MVLNTVGAHIGFGKGLSLAKLENGCFAVMFSPDAETWVSSTGNNEMTAIGATKLPGTAGMSVTVRVSKPTSQGLDAKVEKYRQRLLGQTK
jgi:hypothetical protein